MDKVAAAPIYRPTEEQWRDPLAYIRGIQAEAAQLGICIVRAPLAPTVPGGLVSVQQQGCLHGSDDGLRNGKNWMACLPSTGVPAGWLVGKGDWPHVQAPAPANASAAAGPPPAAACVCCCRPCCCKTRPLSLARGSRKCGTGRGRTGRAASSNRCVCAWVGVANGLRRHDLLLCVWVDACLLAPRLLPALFAEPDAPPIPVLP
jgi:hypothetical protein